MTFNAAAWGTRHTFTLMCFLSYALCFSVRVDLAVAIVDMVDTNGDCEVCNSATKQNVESAPCSSKQRIKSIPLPRRARP